MLAYLAVAGRERGLERDALLPVFWPDQDISAGRNALNQAVHGLRRALGADSIESDSTHLRLAVPLAVDAWQFELAEGAAALELYGGPFLDGFTLPGVPEFDRWTLQQRSHYALAAAEHAWQLAEDAAARGESQLALDLGQRARAILPPLDEVAFRRWLRLLDLTGSRARALTEYAEFATALSVLPAPETAALVAEIRARSDARDHESDLPPLRRRRRRTVAVLVLLVTILAAMNIAGLRDPERRALRALEIELADATETTSSRAARAAYVRGEAEFRAGRFIAAVAQFEAATREDSSYALGYYGLSRAANWSGQSAIASRAAETAVRLGTDLPPMLHDLVNAWHKGLAGWPVEAEQLYTRVLVAAPDHRDALAELADIRYHWGSFFGSPAVDTRLQWERLIQLDSTNAEALRHVARLYAARHDTVAFIRTERRLRAHGPDAESLLELDLLRAFALEDSADTAALIARLLAFEEMPRRALVRAAAFVAPERREITAELGPALLFGHSYQSWELGEVLIRAQMELTRGRFRRAEGILDSAQALGPRAAHFRVATLLPPIRNADQAQLRRELAALRTAPERTADVPYGHWRLYLIGTIAARVGDLAVAESAGRALENYREERSATHQEHAHIEARIVRAEVLRARGDHAGALAALGAPQTPPDHRLPHIWTFPRAHERFLRAQLLAALGRHDEALRWYRTFPDPSCYDLMYVPDALRGEIEAYEQLGDRAAADAARARFVALWRDADQR